MINVTPQIITALSQTGLKVYNENFLKNESVPCISYYEYDNNIDENCDIMEYSNIIYHIKIWAKTQKELVDYSSQIDKIMREQGFKRTGCNDLWTDTLGQRDLKYKALALEIYE